MSGIMAVWAYMVHQDEKRGFGFKPEIAMLLPIVAAWMLEITFYCKWGWVNIAAIFPVCSHLWTLEFFPDSLLLMRALVTPSYSGFPSFSDPHPTHTHTYTFICHIILCLAEETVPFRQVTGQCGRGRGDGERFNEVRSLNDKQPPWLEAERIQTPRKITC